jgi:hypothetical protein
MNEWQSLCSMLKLRNVMRSAPIATESERYNRLRRKSTLVSPIVKQTQDMTAEKYVPTK